MIRWNHADKCYLCYQEGLQLGYHVVPAAQLRFLFLITQMSTSNTAAWLEISGALAITEDKAYEKHMLSFHAKKTEVSVGTGGLDELLWYEVFPLEKEQEIFLEFALAPLKSSIMACILLKGGGFLSYDTGKTRWRVGYLKIEAVPQLPPTRLSEYIALPLALVTPMQMNAMQRNKR